MSFTFDTLTLDSTGYVITAHVTFSGGGPYGGVSPVVSPTGITVSVNGVPTGVSLIVQDPSIVSSYFITMDSAISAGRTVAVVAAAGNNAQLSGGGGTFITAGSYPVTNNSTVVAPVGTMTVGTSRQLLDVYIRNALDANVNNQVQKDHSFRSAADYLIMRNRMLPITNSITLAVGTSVLPALPTNFRPDRLMNAYLTGSNVIVDQGNENLVSDSYLYTEAAPTYLVGRRRADLVRPNYTALNNWLLSNGSLTGQPAAIAFDTWTTGDVFPIPDTSGPYNCVLQWCGFFTSWTLGATDTTTTNTVLNLPDDLLMGVLMFGAPAFAQLNQPDQKYAALAMQKFEDWILKVAGEGNTGAESIVADRKYR